MRKCREENIWGTFPSTIYWLRLERDAAISRDPKFRTKPHYRGINATIVLLSAACIEGFLVESLTWQVLFNREKSTAFQRRMEDALSCRISKATFDEFPDLFRVVLGKPLSDLISDKSLLEGVRALITFRNGVAHARSTHYVIDDESDPNEIKFEVDGQYEVLDKYLISKNLRQPQSQVIYTDEIADHFADLVEPYINEVISVLQPNAVVKNMSDWAFAQINALKKEHGHNTIQTKSGKQATP